jgi:hypothetical protein
MVEEQEIRQDSLMKVCIVRHLIKIDIRSVNAEGRR